MTRFIKAESRAQATLFPERIEDYIDEESKRDRPRFLLSVKGNLEPLTCPFG